MMVSLNTKIEIQKISGIKICENSDLEKNHDYI